jgi:hypothetical protein
MLFRVDVSGLDAVMQHAREGESTFREDFPAAFARSVSRHVRMERQGHAYTNRTGNAERSTRARIARTSNAIDIDAEAGADYASYLDRGGWSDFSSLMGEAMAEIDNGVEAINRRLSR